MFSSKTIAQKAVMGKMHLISFLSPSLQNSRVSMWQPGTKTLSSTHDRKADPVLLGSSLTRVRVFYFNQTLNSLLPASFPLPLLIPSLFPLSSVHNMHQYSPLLITFQLHIFSVLKVQSDTHGRKGSTHPTLTKYE